MLSKFFLIALIAAGCLGCARDRTLPANTAEAVVAEPKLPPPKTAQAQSGNQQRISMLFYHEPDHCPHCRYEMPQVRSFQQNHSEVNVIWRPAGTASARERELLRGVSGHPIMAFYTDDGHTMLVRGETSTAELDAKLSGFKKDISVASQNGKRVSQTTGSNIVCP
jgi:hypothetical protein